MKEQPSSQSGLDHTGPGASGAESHGPSATAPAGNPPAGARRSFWRRALGALIRTLGVLALLAILAAVSGAGAFWWWANRAVALRRDPPGAFEAAAPDDSGTSASRFVAIEVHAGDSLVTVARRIDSAGIAGPWQAIVALAVMQRLDRGVQPGHYALERGTAPIEVLRRLTAARPRREEIRVTFPEGWTTLQIADRLAERGIVASRERFLTLCRDADFLRSLGVPAADAQGYLFPDTYFFQPATDEAEVIRRLVAQFRAVALGTGAGQIGLLPGQNSPNAQPLGFAEGIALASIIEREARLAEEMPRIASVYHNRLAKKMRLESCATVRYALDKWHSPLTLGDLDSDSPYNTYRHTGLPPGPICNPGRDAIAAAFRPEATPYLFYVYRGDNHHEFTRTYEEHEAARKRFKDAWAQPIVRPADAAGAGSD